MPKGKYRRIESEYHLASHEREFIGRQKAPISSFVTCFIFQSSNAGLISKMTKVCGRAWRRNKLPPLSCSPEETLKNEVPLNMEKAEKILDTDSVSSAESVSILSQSQLSFPTQLKRENALHVFPRQS